MRTYASEHARDERTSPWEGRLEPSFMALASSMVRAARPASGLQGPSLVSVAGMVDRAHGRVNPFDAKSTSPGMAGIGCLAVTGSPTGCPW